MSKRHQSTLRWLTLPAAVALAACASNRADEGSARQVPDLIAHGRYDEAVRVAAERHEANPGDAALEHQWRMATVALLLERGRRLNFEDRDVEALEAFREAHAIGPEVPQVRMWIAATLDKLARRWAEMGQEWHAKENLDEAVRCYEAAVGFQPENKLAREGLTRALLQQNFRRGESQKYYQDGVHALDAYWLDEAVHDFSASLKYQEGHDRAERRRTQTNSLLADERVYIAFTLESEGRFAAARNEYRIANMVDPEHAEALAGLERTKVEEKAAEFLREAERMTLRREFDRAQAALEQGRALTERQVEAFEKASEALTEARLWQKYDAALALENDYRYEDAIVAYTALLEEAPYFEDTIARRDTLEDFVAKAAEHYAEALAASEPAEQLKALRQVMIVYPEYKDTRDRVEALEAVLGKDEPSEPR